MYTEYDKSVLRMFSENFSNNFRDEDPDQMNQIDTTFQGYQDDDFNEDEQLDEALRVDDEGPNAKRYDKYGIRQVWNDIESDQGEVDFKSFSKKFKERLQAIAARRLIPFSQGTLDGCLSVWKGTNRLRNIPSGYQGCTVVGFVLTKDDKHWRFICGRYGSEVKTAIIGDTDKTKDVNAVMDQFIKGLNIKASDGIYYTKNSTTSLRIVIAEAGSKYRKELSDIGLEFLNAITTKDIKKASVFKDLTLKDQVSNFFTNLKGKIKTETIPLVKFADDIDDKNKLKNCFDPEDLTYLPTPSEVEGAKTVLNGLKWKNVKAALEDQEDRELSEEFRKDIDEAIKAQDEAEVKEEVDAEEKERARTEAERSAEKDRDSNSGKRSSKSKSNHDSDESESENSSDNESDDDDEDEFAKGLRKLANELQAKKDAYIEVKYDDDVSQGGKRAKFQKFTDKILEIGDFFTKFKRGYSDKDFIENFAIDEKSLVDFGFSKKINLADLPSKARNDLEILTSAYEIGEKVTGLKLIKFKDKTQDVIDAVKEKEPEELQKAIENPDDVRESEGSKDTEPEIDKSDVKDAVTDAAKPLALTSAEQKEVTTLVLKRMEELDFQDDSSVKDVVKALYKDIKGDIKSLEDKDRVELLNGILQSLNLSDSAEVRLKNGRLTIASNSDSPLVTKDEIRKRVGTALHVLKLGDAAPIEDALKDFNTGKETRTQDEIEQAFKTAGLAESIRNVSKSLKESHSDDMVALMRFDKLEESVFMDEDLCIDSQAGTAELDDLLYREVLPTWAGVDTVEKAQDVLRSSSDPNAEAYLEMLNTAETNAKFVDEVLAGL